MLYVERLQNEKKNANGAEKSKLDLKVSKLTFPMKMSKLPVSKEPFKISRVWTWKLERNKNNKQQDPPDFHQCSTMGTDHHNSRLLSDKFDKREQYCCPPMPLKLPYFEISGKPFGNKWDALTSFLNHFIYYYVI